MAFFTTKTVDSVLAVFTKTVADLTAVADSSREQSSFKYAQAKELEDAAYELNREADRAERIKGKLEDLLND